jgi:hypothetical protein
MVNVFSFAGLVVSAATPEICHHHGKAATDNE